ncbi:MAG: maleylacetoacetate isomerase [Pseudomonadota bacterium]
MSEAVLYDYWRSSASYRVRIALNLAGVRYQSEVIDLVSGQQRSEVHLALNPQGLVPALEIDGTVLTQSLAILDYLAETRALALLPDDEVMRAKVRALAHCLAVDVHPVCNLQVVRHVEALTNDPNAKAAWMKHFIRPGLEAFEALTRDLPIGDFCVGNQPGLADICLIPQLYNARRWGVDYSDLGRLAAIDDACLALRAFGDARPEAVDPERSL